MRAMHFMTLIEGIKLRFMAPLAMRQALRALHRSKRHAWFLCDLLEHRLKHGLISPEEVMRALRSWRAHAEQYELPVPTCHTLADVVTTTE